MSDITTASDLKEFVNALIDKHSLTDRAMGDYLRAVWAALLVHKDDVVTYALLAQIIEAGYVVEPLRFDADWLKVERQSWMWDEDSKSYAIRKFDETSKSWVILDRHVDSFCILENALLEQILERYLLENEPSNLSEKERKNLRNNWSNPHPYPYLQTAMYVMYDESANIQRNERAQADLDWIELVAILSIGQAYD